MVSQSILIKLWLLTNKNTEEFNVFVMWLQQVDRATTNLVGKKTDDLVYLHIDKYYLLFHVSLAQVHVTLAGTVHQTSSKLL